MVNPNCSGSMLFCFHVTNTTSMFKFFIYLLIQTLQVWLLSKADFIKIKKQASFSLPSMFPGQENLFHQNNNKMSLRKMYKIKLFYTHFSGTVAKSLSIMTLTLSGSNPWKLQMLP